MYCMLIECIHWNLLMLWAKYWYCPNFIDMAKRVHRSEELIVQSWWFASSHTFWPQFTVIVIASTFHCLSFPSLPRMRMISWELQGLSLCWPYCWELSRLFTAQGSLAEGLVIWAKGWVTFNENSHSSNMDQGLCLMASFLFASSAFPGLYPSPEGAGGNDQVSGESSFYF